MPLAACSLSFSCSSAPARPRSGSSRPSSAPGSALAADRAVPWRACTRGQRRTGPATAFLFRQRQRRRLGNRRRRTHLAADLRQPAGRLDRRARRRAVRSEGHLRRHGRSGHALGHRAGRRHVRVTRRRQERGRTSGLADSQQIARILRRSRRCRTVSTSPRSAIPTARTPNAACSARATAARSWQHVLGNDDATRRDRPRLRAGQSEVDLRGDVADPAHAVEHLSAGQRPGQRPVQVDRRRRQLDARSAATDFPTQGSGASASPWRRAIRSAFMRSSTRDDGRAVPLRRRRRELDAHQRRRPRIWARGWYFGAVAVDPNECRRRLRAATRSCCAPTMAARPSRPLKGAPGGDDYPRALDRSRRPRNARSSASTRARSSPSTAARPGAPGTTSRPRSSITSAPTTAFRTASTARSRTPAQPRLPSRSERRATASRWRTSARSPPAARAATSRPIRRIRTSSTAAASTSSTCAREQTRSVDPTLAEPDLYRRTWTLPLVFSPRDPRALYFGNQKIWPHRRRRRALEGDQPRPDARESGRSGRISTSHRRATPSAPARVAAWSTRSRRRARRSQLLWAGTDDGLIWRTRRWRSDWNERHADGARRLVEGRHHRSVALRRRHRLRGHRPPPPRRPQALHLPHARRRQDAGS